MIKNKTGKFKTIFLKLNKFLMNKYKGNINVKIKNGLFKKQNTLKVKIFL